MPEITLTDEESRTVIAGQNEGLQQVVTQLTKNLIDGTMNLNKYKLEVIQAIERVRSSRT